jgi:hypothetical protein
MANRLAPVRPADRDDGRREHRQSGPDDGCRGAHRQEQQRAKSAADAAAGVDQERDGDAVHRQREQRHPLRTGPVLLDGLDADQAEGEIGDADAKEQPRQHRAHTAVGCVEEQQQHQHHRHEQPEDVEQADYPPGQVVLGFRGGWAGGGSHEQGL